LMIDLVREVGAEVIAIGSLVHFSCAKLDIGDIPYKSLVNVDAYFATRNDCDQCKAGEPIESVRV